MTLQHFVELVTRVHQYLESLGPIWYPIIIAVCGYTAGLIVGGAYQRALMAVKLEDILKSPQFQPEIE